jgi:hypothetical protein
MTKLMLFGKQVEVQEAKGGRDVVEFRDGKILVKGLRSASSLLRDFLVELLYSELCKIYEAIRNGGKVALFGDLDFEVVDKIDRKNERIAKIKGNKILVKLSAIALPGEALKYMLAHEMAHIAIKRHTNKFWKVVETIYPGFEIGEKLFAEAGKFLASGEPLCETRSGTKRKVKAGS